MSHITNVILTFSIMEDFHDTFDDGEAIYDLMNSINTWLSENGHRSFGHSAGRVSGDRYLETPLYIAAFNYLRIDAFMAMLSSLPWKEPENVQLFIEDQDDDKFQLFELCGRVMEPIHRVRGQ